MTKREFDRLRRQGEYSQLGWFFWKCFLTLPLESKVRQRASAQFNSLTRREKRLCERV